MEKAAVDIDGMTCDGCVRSVKRVLSGLAGVDAIDVSLEKNQATINFDPQIINTAQIRRSLEDAGYKTR